MQILEGRTWSRLLRALAFLGVAGGLASCGEIRPVAPQEEPITNPAQLYMALTLDHRAVTLSTAAGYNTLQLTATPRDALGNSMPDLPAPIYASSDTAKVRVSANGLVTAVGVGSGVKVTATLTAGPVTRTDEARIDITDLTSPPKLASLSIHPIPPDTAVWPTRGRGFTQGILGQVGLYDPAFAGYIIETINQRYLVARAVDTAGAAVPGVLTEYASLDPIVATANPWTGEITLRHPGQVQLIARATAYGVAKADTVAFTVTLPFAESVDALSGPTGAPIFTPSSVRIVPYGYVGWFNRLGDAVDVTFDNPAGVAAPPAAVCDVLVNQGILLGVQSATFCDAGNVLIPVAPALPPFLPPQLGPVFTVQLRQFPLPGVYTYHSTTGATGRIVVTADPYAATVN